MKQIIAVCLLFSALTGYAEDQPAHVGSIELVDWSLSNVIRLYELIAGREVINTVKTKELFTFSSEGELNRERAIWMLKEVLRLHGFALTKEKDGVQKLIRVDEGVFYGDKQASVEQRLGDVLAGFPDEETLAVQLEMIDVESAFLFDAIEKITQRTLLEGRALPDVKISLSASEFTRACLKNTDDDGSNAFPPSARRTSPWLG